MTQMMKCVGLKKCSCEAKSWKWMDSFLSAPLSNLCIRIIINSSANTITTNKTITLRGGKSFLVGFIEGSHMITISDIQEPIFCMEWVKHNMKVVIIAMAGDRDDETEE